VRKSWCQRKGLTEVRSRRIPAIAGRAYVGVPTPGQPADVQTQEFVSKAWVLEPRRRVGVEVRAVDRKWQSSAAVRCLLAISHHERRFSATAYRCVRLCLSRPYGVRAEDNVVGSGAESINCLADARAGHRRPRTV